MTAGQRYGLIVEDLEAAAVAELWLAALFGRPVREALKGALAELNALRDEIGRQSARRARGVAC